MKMNYFEITDRIAAMLKGRMETKQVVEFKQLLQQLKEQWGQHLCREKFIKEYFGDATREEYKVVMTKLLRITKKLGISTFERNRYFKVMESDVRNGVMTFCYRKEVLTYYAV